MTVEIVSQGNLMQIKHAGITIILDRDEALELLARINAKLGEMPVKL